MKLVFEIDFTGNPEALLKVLDAAFKSGAKVQTGSKLSEKAKAEPEEDNSILDEEDEAPKVTLDQIKAKVVSLTNDGKGAQAKAALKKHGVEKVSLLPPEKFDAYFATINKL